MPTIFMTVFCDLAPRSFFPGRSFFFWLLIAMGFYLLYLYSSSKNKKDFIKSPYILSVSVALLLFFCTYLTINTFLTDPPNVYIQEEKEKDVNELLKEEHSLFEDAERDFTHTVQHYRLITTHFELPKTWTTDYGEFREREEYSLLNFYTDKLETLTDSLYLNNAKLGLGLVYYYKGDYTAALIHLESISDSLFPFLNFYKGNICLANKDTLKAISFFSQGSKVYDTLHSESTFTLIQLLNERNDIPKLFSLLYQENYKPFFTHSLATKIYFVNNRIYDYYSLMISRVFQDFKWTGFIAALVILITWGMFIVRMDIFEKENKLIMLLVMITGMAFSLGCFYLYDYLTYTLNFNRDGNVFIYCIFGIGFVEELMKIIPLLLLLLLAPKEVNEPYDYILYAALSALGFSFMENLMYFDGNLNSVIHGRALTSVPGHIIFSSIVAYGFVLAKYRYKNTLAWLTIPSFFLFGMISHGLYDYWIFANLNILFIIGFLLSVSFWIIIINNSLNNSPSFNYLIASKPHSRQLILSLSLLSILVLEYIMVAWEKGPLYANLNFNGNLFFGGIIITYYSSRLNNIDLVRGYWGGIPWKTINEKRSDAELDWKNFLIRIFSGDTFTHSFVNHEIFLQTNPENEKLYAFFTSSVKGIITDRLVVSCKSSKGKAYEDPFWFRLEVSKPIEVGGGMEQTFLLRFEDVRPSFENSHTLTIYLFALKSKDDLSGKISRENLRALGKAFVRR